MFGAEYRLLNCKVTSFHEELKMLIHGVVMGSRVNGPGLRAVVYFQGCKLGCRNCWNPTTHTFTGDEGICDLNHKMALSAILSFPVVPSYPLRYNWRSCGRRARCGKSMVYRQSDGC